ncbi:sensor histidine kinase [Streptomyces flavofungini]|uniref:histidine kinase n=1 Tax=Streptomyces flavofungini TaxID=68200 RepID=A0ABS0XBI3_9ACTN|nr:HAMP domain-containing sensor histidine kinase [Streptomyces flavofungini]MBJ3810577.1 HAMP domain-containing histidine kinase [Streptomyces flavofungini]GHC83819.1 two-component sensor histidine kinase [Streptomyces flavofungini]
MIRRIARTYRRMRLGTRLALGLGVLALAVFAVVGTALSTYMRDYLERQLNDQMALVQGTQAKDAKVHGTVERQPYYRWYTAVYDVAGGRAVLRRPSEVPADAGKLSAVAEVQRESGAKEVFRTTHIEGQGAYRLRACEVSPGVVLVTAAPLEDIEETMDQLLMVQVVAFSLALVGLVGLGRSLLRRGLKPLSDMAHTARGITSHDFTDSAGLPVRVDSDAGGPEVGELRTAFNTMLDHIDDSLAVRTEAEQRLRRFVADASHELRTPLMSVRGYADLFQYAAANEPAERDKHLARLRAEAARMGLLLDDLLLLARLDAADVETPLRLADTDPAELVNEAADAFRAGRPDHPLSVRVDGDPAALLRLDPLRIRQVLDNLLSNAAVHTPAGTQVSLSLSVSADAAVVQVADSGPGIPAADQERVFDRFYRVDKARTRDRGGSGLGLAVARSLIRAHNGTIELTSQAGSTVFTLRIPR